MCIAILNNSLVRISIKFRPQVPNCGAVALNDSAAGDGIRSSVHDSHQVRDADAVEKRCTLLPLATMSCARCGLGAAVLSGQLVAVGTLLVSV